MIYDAKTTMMLNRLTRSREACVTLHRLMEMSETFTNTMHLKDIEYVIERLNECIAILRDQHIAIK